jgi:hypothetical protein
MERKSSQGAHAPELMAHRTRPSSCPCIAPDKPGTMRREVNRPFLGCLWAPIILGPALACYTRYVLHLWR